MSLWFVAGMLAAVNPCGFVLLPTYLMYFLGLQGIAPGTQRATIRTGGPGLSGTESRGAVLLADCT